MRAVDPQFTSTSIGRERREAQAGVGEGMGERERGKRAQGAPWSAHDERDNTLNRVPFMVMPQPSVGVLTATPWLTAFGG